MRTPPTFAGWMAAVATCVALTSSAAPVHRPIRHRAAPRVAARPPAAPSAPAVPGLAGMVVGMDPETGQLGPATAAQRLVLSAQETRMLSHSSEGLVEVRHPDGSASINLQGRFQEFAVIGTGPDGRPRLQCVSSAAAARRALNGSPAPAPAPEDR